MSDTLLALSDLFYWAGSYTLALCVHEPPEHVSEDSYS